MPVMAQGAHRGRPVAAAPCTPGLRPAKSPLHGPFDLSLQASGRAEAASVQNTALSPHPCGLPRPSGNVSAILRPPAPAVSVAHVVKITTGRTNRRPDKAFMPPSGTTAGTVSDVYRPASLRLRGPTLFEPAKGLVGRIRHLFRHPAQPRVRRLMCIARRRCACAGLRCLNQQRTRRPDKAKPSGKRREERHYSAAVFPLPGSLNASP